MILEGRQFVFLASIDWNAPWQRHQVWANAFAEAGNEVFFVENTGFRGPKLSDAARIGTRLWRLAKSVSKTQIPAGIHVISPAVLPHTGLSRGLNRHVFIPRLIQKLKAVGLHDHPVVFAYLPTHTTLEILEALEPSLTVYDCVDNFAGHPTPPKDLELTEFGLLKRADAVITTSHFLYEKCCRVSSEVHELHHGVAEAFLQAREERPPVAYKKFCYFGTLWSAIDYRPLAALAEAGFEVTLIGPIKEKPPPLPKSVRFRPTMVRASDLPGLIAQFDGTLLPYADTAYNQGVLPAKTYECLASGKPVLASPIPELRRFNDVFYLAKTPQEWVEIAKRLPNTETPEKRKARTDLARAHSTNTQFKELCRILSDAQRLKQR